MADQYDVIIVGSGAGGGTLAHRLAPSGKRVLILERGDWLPREPQNWDAEAVFVDNRYVSKDTWFDSEGKAFQPQIHYFVGGATKFYGAALYRLRERDFGELKHHGGISPAWPIDYDVLEPYYTQAEHLYQVHGVRGEDPTEPPASAPYPFPPVSHEPRIQRLFDDMAKVGMHPFHAPAGIMLDEAEPAFSACIRCATCDGFPCLVHAKSDADVIAVRPALRHSNVTLVRNAYVRRLETDSSGRTVTAVVAEVDGAEQRFSADVVVISAGAVNSAKLLLASANDRHPNGLANGSDQVGRNYVFHNSRAFLAVSTEKNDTRFQKTLGVNDYYFGDAGLRLPDGQPADGREVVGADVPRREAHRVGSGPDVPARRRRGACRRLLAVGRGPARPGQPGDARPRRTGRAELHPNNQEPMEQLYHRVKKHLSHLGMHPHHLIPRDVYMKNDIPVAGCAHQAGTVRFGADPATSVLDTDCKAHEVDNLYVVDTSFFPSIGAVNPALTAIANALRVGDHLLARLG